MWLQVAGFSGTNDNDPLLPLTVKAMKSEDLSIQATDGRLLRLISDEKTCSVLPLCSSESDATAPVWSRLLDLAIQEKAHALIDAGSPLRY